MFNCNTPLQYQISNWKQLSKCLSNNSKELHIKVTEFIQDDRLSGTRIAVHHDVFGVLFSYIVDASGSIISDFDPNISPNLTVDQILIQLAKFGFLVKFKENENLSGDQIQYLMTLDSLHFDKLRILNFWKSVNGVKQFTTVVVAFQVQYLPDWLNSGYSPNQDEYTTALNNGWAINLSSISKDKHYRWDWLYNWVANISDIISDNI